MPRKMKRIYRKIYMYHISEMYIIIEQTPNGDTNFLNNDPDLETAIGFLHVAAENYITEHAGRVNLNYVSPDKNLNDIEVNDGLYLVDYPINRLENHPFFKNNSSEFRSCIRFCCNVYSKKTKVVDKGWVFSSMQAEREVVLERAYILRFFKESKSGVESTTLCSRQPANTKERIGMKQNFGNVLLDINQVHASQSNPNTARPPVFKFSTPAKLAEVVNANGKLYDFLDAVCVIDVPLTRKLLYGIIQNYITENELIASDAYDPCKNDMDLHKLRATQAFPPGGGNVNNIVCNPELADLLEMQVGDKVTMYKLRNMLEQYLTVKQEEKPSEIIEIPSA